MGRFVTYKCDECSTVKEASNHWWIVRKASAAGNPEFAILPMPADCREDVTTVCGRECVQKMVEKWMAEFSGS